MPGFLAGGSTSLKNIHDLDDNDVGVAVNNVKSPRAKQHGGGKSAGGGKRLTTEKFPGKGGKSSPSSRNAPTPKKASSIALRQMSKEMAARKEALGLPQSTSSADPTSKD